MRTNHGNRDARFVYQGSLAGVTNVDPGDGITPSKPIAEHGGLLKFVTDVDVPAILAGAQADFSVTYPGSYTSPAPDFHLLRYAEPLDTAKKLNTKGNLWIQKAVVMQGTGLTGAAQWTMAGGTVAISIRVPSPSTNIWDFNGTMPTGQTIITPSNELAKGVIIGTDASDAYLAFRVSPTTNNIVAGRVRIILIGCEV